MDTSDMFIKMSALLCATFVPNHSPLRELSHTTWPHTKSRIVCSVRSAASGENSWQPHCVGTNMPFVIQSADSLANRSLCHVQCATSYSMHIQILAVLPHPIFSVTCSVSRSTLTLWSLCIFTWRFKSFVVWHCASGWVIPDISKVHSAFIFKCKKGLTRWRHYVHSECQEPLEWWILGNKAVRYGNFTYKGIFVLRKMLFVIFCKIVVIKCTNRRLCA